MFCTSLQHKLRQSLKFYKKSKPLITYLSHRLTLLADCQKTQQHEVKNFFKTRRSWYLILLIGKKSAYKEGMLLEITYFFYLRSITSPHNPSHVRFPTLRFAHIKTEFFHWPNRKRAISLYPFLKCF